LLESEIFIQSIELGSYKENFAVRLIFGEGADAEKKIDELRKFLRLDAMSAKTLVGFVIAAALGYGAYLFLRPGEPKPIHIENSFNSFGKDLNLDGDQVIALFEAAIKNKEDLKKDVVRVFHPAGTDKTSEIYVDKKPNLTITREVIAQVPKDYAKPEPDETFEVVSDAPLIIRALDLDDPEKGWAAILPELSEKRMPIEITSEIDILKIPVNKIIYGDVEVLMRKDAKGKKQIKRYTLKSLIPHE
jgi:hypothetical protein